MDDNVDKDENVYDDENEDKDENVDEDENEDARMETCQG